MLYCRSALTSSQKRPILRTSQMHVWKKPKTPCAMASLDHPIGAEGVAGAGLIDVHNIRCAPLLMLSPINWNQDSVMRRIMKIKRQESFLMRVALLWPIFFPIQAHLHMSENGNSPPRCRWAPSRLRARATAGLEKLFFLTNIDQVVRINWTLLIVYLLSSSFTISKLSRSF